MIEYRVGGQWQVIDHIGDGRPFEASFQFNAVAGKSIGIQISVKTIERKPGFGEERRTLLFIDEIQFD